MHFNQEVYDELQGVWYNHRILERVHMEIESNGGLIRITWRNM